jgi:16S rRNA U516 pseudouridylate synthase RsuA-like enzyme
MVLTQGINRQIHKMMWRVGEYDVKRLVRTRIGPVSLRDLAPGRWRLMSRAELSGLLEAARGKR